MEKQSTEKKERPIIQVIEAPKNTGTRKLFIAIAVGLCLAITGYALSVDNFTDYTPPDYLYINWADYQYRINDNWVDTPAMNNAPTGTPRLTVDYPYRALFFGRDMSVTGIDYEGRPQGVRMFVVYSKTPVTDKFTFEYYGSNRNSKSGRMRALIPLSRINNIDTYNPENNSDILIYGYFLNGSNAASTPHLATVGMPSTQAGTSSYGTQPYGTYSQTHFYFNFDFFYDCASEHQQGARDLHMNGLTSISGVPYNYIIHCLDHTGYTGGSTSGGGSSSGGSSSSTGSSKWGGGKYGGGIDWGNNGAPSINSGGGYTTPTFGNRDDITFNPSSNWKDRIQSGRENSGLYPWEIDSNIPNYNFEIPTPPFTGQGNGDTGKDGSDFSFPIEFPTTPNNIFEIKIPELPNKDKLTVIEFPPHLYFTDAWPPQMR